MKKLLGKLGFHKTDEMEQSILFKSQRNSYIFLTLSLLIWTFYESYKVYAYHTRLNILPCMLLTASVIIQNISRLIMTHNAVKGDEDAPKESPVLRTALMWLIIAAVIISIGNFIIFRVIKL